MATPNRIISLLHELSVLSTLVDCDRFRAGIGLSAVLLDLERTAEPHGPQHSSPTPNSAQ